MSTGTIGTQTVHPGTALQEREALACLPAKLFWLVATLFAGAFLVDYLGAPDSQSVYAFLLGLAAGSVLELGASLGIVSRFNPDRPGVFQVMNKILTSLNSTGALAALALLFGDAALGQVPGNLAGVAGVVISMVAAARVSPPRAVTLVATVTANAQPSAQGQTLGERDRYMAAIHEAGHALTLAIAPATWRRGAFVQIGDSNSTFTHVPRDESLWTLSAYRRWEMLLYLAGPVATDRAFGGAMEGGAADMRSWRHDAMSVLTAERAEGWTPAPETDLEYRANERLIKALEREQTEALEAFFELNEAVYLELVDHLLAHGGADAQSLEAFLGRVTICHNIERALGL